MQEYQDIYINYRTDAVYGLEFDASLLPEDGDTSRELPWPQQGRLIDKMHYIGTVKEWMEKLKQQQ